MEHRTIFGVVNLVTTEHGVDMWSQAGFFSESKQELGRLVIDAVFRVIEVNARRLGRHPLATLWISSE